MLEVREFTIFGRSGGLEVRMDGQDVLVGIKCSFATSCRLCYDSGDYSTESLVHKITVLDVQIHINNIYRGCCKRNVPGFGRVFLK
jgi:hypothetical protein